VHAEQFRPGTGAAWAAEMHARTADHLELQLRRLSMHCVPPRCNRSWLPGAVFALARTAYPPARAMIDHGLAIVVASDFNPGSSPIPSMPFIVSLACLYMGAHPAEALTAATITPHGALALATALAP